MPSAIKFPIGKSDFQNLRQGNYYYVDKSLFIKQVIEESADILLLPRPRRFGKTLNMSMLRYFLEKSKEDKRGLFSGLQIEESKETWKHFQKYPVVFLTFKDVKVSSWNDAWVAISEILAQLYEEHDYLLQGNHLSIQSLRQFNQILNQQATPAESVSALKQLCKYLHDYHQEKVVILVDEYDTCIHSAYENNYYNEAISFFRNLLSSVLKDNSYLYKGVLTGILRIAKESLFSGLNNVAVYSLLHQSFSSFFGFTEQEVTALTKKVGQTQLLPELKAWYNGYLFGEEIIYNPWSILQVLSNPAEGLKAYWVNTSSNDLVKETLFEHGISTQLEIETLLNGGEIEKPLEENTSLTDLNEDSLWSFLLFTGYLKATAQYNKQDLPYVKLALPNREVKSAFTLLTRSWFQRAVGPSKTVETLLKALFAGDAEKVEEILSHLMKVSMSYWDPSLMEGAHQKAKTKPTRLPEEEKTDPEAVYHAFVLGLLVNLSGDYEVRSNRESGYGRADLMLLPKQKGKPGVVFEFKAIKKAANPEMAMKEALDQLEQNQYKTELVERGASPIFEYAAIFSGKKVSVNVTSKKSQFT